MIYSFDNRHCSILSEQKMFGKVICTIYIPELDKVEP